MFTREHFEQVASILSAARSSANSTKALAVHKVVDQLTDDFAAIFEQDNELFARKAFIRACNAASRSEIRRPVAQSNDKNYQKGQRAKAAARRCDEKW